MQACEFVCGFGFELRQRRDFAPRRIRIANDFDCGVDRGAQRVFESRRIECRHQTWGDQLEHIAELFQIGRGLGIRWRDRTERYADPHRGERQRQVFNAIARKNRDRTLIRQIACRKPGRDALHAFEHLRVADLDPGAAAIATRNERAIGRFLRPFLEQVGQTRRIRRHRASRTQIHHPVRAPLYVRGEFIRRPAKRLGRHRQPSASRSARIAFCFRIRSWTSGLKPASLKSLIQRSGVMSG